MGSGYDHRQLHPKNIFLPMFCRLSIKDIITLNHHRKNPISAATDEPSSPKVSCMGQVKRNNRVVGFPPAAGATHHRRYSKLKRLFSGKTLLPPATASGGGKTQSKSFRFSGEVCVKKQSKLKLKNECEQDCVKVVNIGEIDPPLPVVKRAATPGGCCDEVNLWRRRFNGAAALKGLQIEQVTRSQPPNV
ncbi:hypothetical protein CASFOL_012602 [Castilleja foliolosa]|uniref:Uncharacterized protein n=1 Tax=Castilleja foliolosa TaxID=1961234 RepID=A0ABD3DIA1_9LAMI